jgi:hypothetical protein
LPRPGALAWHDEDDGPQLRQVHRCGALSQRAAADDAVAALGPPEKTVMVSPPAGFRDYRPTACTTVRSRGLKGADL